MNTQNDNNVQIDASIKAELRSTLDIMPLKTVTYMLSFARAHAKKLKSRRRSTILYSRKMLAELRFHKGLIKISKKDGSISSQLLCKGMSGAVYAYAGFFYTLSRKELSEYASMFEGKHSINLLSLPAECALEGKPIDEALESITKYVNAVPLFASRSIVNTVLRIMQFEKSAAIKGVHSQLADKIVQLSAFLDSTAMNIKNSSYSASEAERAKSEVAAVLAGLSSADPYMRDIIAEMIGTEGANTAKLFRIVRKKA
ncbi:MAG: hypothetical protein ACP5UH_03875 [Candidatus Micrarchaeia archaeon]